MAVKYSKQSQKSGATVGTVVCIPKPSGWTSTTDDWDIDVDYPGWLECDGSSLNPNQYYALYEIIGTTYGGTVSGTYPNMTGTFNLPNYRARYLTGTGRSDGNIPGSATLTPNSGAGGGTPIDVNYPGGIGGSYVISDIRQQTPTQDDTFEIVSKKSRGFENVEVEAPITLSGNITQNFGPFGSTQLYSAPPHTHVLPHSRLTNEEAATSADGGPSIVNPPDPGGTELICCLNGAFGSIISYRRRVENASPGDIPTTRKHSHQISANTSGQARTWGHDQEGGNEGISSGAVGYGNTASKTISVTELGLECNVGTLKVSSSSSVRTLFDSRLTTNLTSAETLSMMQAYHRNKYIIKAF